MRFLLPLPWMLTLLCSALHSAPLDTLITAGDLLKITRLESPVISPDGKAIAYTVRTTETAPSGNISYHHRLWLASIDGDEAPRKLSLAGQAESPSWHPSGDRIAFARRENDGRTRIWILPVATGEPHPASPPLRGATAPQWSPDGMHLLFTAIVTYSEVQAALGKSSSSPSPAPTPSPDGSPAEQRAWLKQNEIEGKSVVTHQSDLNATRGTGEEPEFSHLFIITRAGSEPIDLTPGFVSHTHPRWLPDSQTIVCSGTTSDAEHPDRINMTGLFQLKADGTELRPLTKTTDYSLDRPAISPDGKKIACIAYPASTPTEHLRGKSHVAVIGLDDGKLKLITEKFDRSPVDPRWSTDGKFIYFIAETNGGVPIHRVASSGGTPERISSPDTWITGYDVSTDGIALVIGRAGNPAELYGARPTGRSLRILTAHNSDWLRDKKIAAPERRKLKQPDGTQIEYWVVKPPYLESGFHYPLLVIVHDGPASMNGGGNPLMWHDVQFFASRGYGILFVNPRGSSGYGAQFQGACFQQWAPGPAGDVLAAAEVVSREKWIDADRQVILGSGYGGYLTTWITSIDPRFKAAVTVRGIYDLTTFLGGVGSWPLVASHFGGHSWQPDIHRLLETQSPLNRVASIRTPLLIQHNETDDPAVIAQADLLYRSLKLLGRSVESVRYPRTTIPASSLNSLDDPSQSLDRLVRCDEFFQRFIGIPVQPVPPPPLPTTPAVPASSTPAVPPAMEQPNGDMKMGAEAKTETMSVK
jgi:dipeptidyl aminopeptidase/acylaminoacyl peptidase